MTARRTTGVLVVGAAAGVAMLAAPASAAAPAHLAGTFQVKQTIVKQVNGGGTGVSTATYRFAANCPTGSCAVKMTRTHGDGSTLTYVIKPTSNGAYTGSPKPYLGSCYSGTNVLVKNGYTYTETAMIKPTKVVSGSTAAFTGTLNITFKATAVGKAHNCLSGYIHDALKSVKFTPPPA